MLDRPDAPEIDDDELREVEAAICVALDARRADDLRVLGFGETSLAVAWPTTQPRLVVKRMTATRNPVDADEIAAALDSYVEQMSAHVTIASTSVRTVESVDGPSAVYFVQELFDPSVLVDNLLAETPPSSDHPILAALIDVITSTTESGQLGVDAQLSNFAWIDDRLVLFDLGTPFDFDADGALRIDTRHFVEALPRPIRTKAARQVTEMLREMSTRRGSFFHAALGLRRVGLDDWLGPTLDAFGPHVDPAISIAEVDEHIERTHAQTRGLKQMMRLQRFWMERVKRDRYQNFITDSFTGELL